MVKFKNIEIEGFGSIISKTFFNLEQPGLNIIRGKVGAGKTSIPSSLCWVIYGQNLKGNKSSILTWPDIRPKGYAGCKVSVEFELNGKTYTIIRCKEFKRQIRIGDTKTKGANKLFLLCDGKPIHGEKGKPLLQREIDKIIGYSFDLFKNTIVFGQKMKRIIEETGPQKKKVFEEAFEATFIKQAAENTDIEKKELESLLRKLHSERELLDESIIVKKDSIKDLKSITDNYKEIQKQYKTRISELESEQGEIRNLTRKDNLKLNEKLKKLETKLKVAREYNANISRAREEVIQIGNDISELIELQSRKGKKCYTCGNTLQKDTYEMMQNKLDKQIKQKREKRKKIKPLSKKTFTDITELENKVRKLYVKIKQNNHHNNEVAGKKNQVPLIQNKINKIQADLNNLNLKENLKKIKNLKLELEDQKLTVKQNIKKSKKLNKSIELKQWLLKDPLSNNGLKVYMFNELLGLVNEQLIKYSDILGFRIEFGIDLSTRNKDFYQMIMVHNIVIPYDDLSGGQKQLVDTSVAFAIHDVVSSIKPTNLVFLDEPFESLGVDEVEVIAELVEEKSKEKSLFLITHHTNFAPLNSNEITVKLGKALNTIIS